MYSSPSILMTSEERLPICYQGVQNFHTAVLMKKVPKHHRHKGTQLGSLFRVTRVQRKEERLQGGVGRRVRKLLLYRSSHASDSNNPTDPSVGLSHTLVDEGRS